MKCVSIVERVYYEWERADSDNVKYEDWFNERIGLIICEKGMEQSMKKIILHMVTLMIAISVIFFTMWTIVNRLCKTIKREEDMKNKMSEFYVLLVRWLALKQNNSSLKDFFVTRNYKKVAIYGMKELGQRLCVELKDTEIEVSYAIDRNVTKVNSDVRVVSPDANLEEVDVIVVTAIHCFDEIKQKLQKKIKCPIISLEEVMYCA